MSSKPETKFIGRVHKHVPKAVYHMKNHNPYMGGVADCYYSARGGSDMWIEYKYMTKIPQRVDVSSGVTSLQFDWLKDRHEDGRNVAIVVGCPTGGVVFRIDEPQSITPAEFCERLLTDKEIAAWIVAQTK